MGAGAADHVKDCGFDAFGSGVSGGDEVEFEPGFDLAQEVVAGEASGFFDSDFEVLGHCRDVGFAGDEGDSPVVALELAEFELFVGGLALAVVEVRGDDFVA